MLQRSNITLINNSSTHYPQTFMNHRYGVDQQAAVVHMMKTSARQTMEFIKKDWDFIEFGQYHPNSCKHPLTIAADSGRNGPIEGVANQPPAKTTCKTRKTSGEYQRSAFGMPPRLQRAGRITVY